MKRLAARRRCREGGGEVGKRQKEEREREEVEKEEEEEEEEEEIEEEEEEEEADEKSEEELEKQVRRKGKKRTTAKDTNKMIKSAIKSISPKTLSGWRKWLERNHSKESSVLLVQNKKHTGKRAFTHKEAMLEAICFGWIDTAIRRIDDDTFSVRWVRRGKAARWSHNTLAYAADLLASGRMAPAGIEAYERGRGRAVCDHGLAKDAPLPEDFVAELEKNDVAKRNFEEMCASARRQFHVWIHRAKKEETRKRRIVEAVARLQDNKKMWQ